MTVIGWGLYPTDATIMIGLQRDHCPHPKAMASEDIAFAVPGSLLKEFESSLAAFAEDYKNVVGLYYTIYCTICYIILYTQLYNLLII